MDTVVAIVADTHCGSHLGLIPPKQWQLDAGGYYDPSKYQNFLWKVWAEYWEEIAKMRRSKKLIVVFNGDSIQGVDQRFTALVSQRPEEHERIFVECMDWGLKTAKFNAGKGDKLYAVRGTERHTGPGAESEERVARDLEAEVLDGRHSSYHIRLNVNNVVFDFAHKRAKAGSRWWTEGNGLYLTAKDAYARFIDRRDFKPPFDVILVGSHYHHWIPYGQHRGPQGMVTCVITPCFQLLTGYSIEVTKGLEPPTVGALAFTVFEGGSWKATELVYTPDYTPSARV